MRSVRILPDTVAAASVRLQPSVAAGQTAAAAEKMAIKVDKCRLFYWVF